MSSSKTPLVVVVGEILFDIIREKKHLGGAPFNFAWHMLHMGFRVRFVSRIGRDENGREIIERLKNLDFPATDIQIDPEYATGTVTVTLDNAGTPKFDIAAPVAYDHIEFMEESHAPLLHQADCVYFGTLAQRRPCGHAQIQRFLEHMPESVICFYDINLRPDGYTEAAILKSLARTTVLKLNEDELDVCGQLLDETGQGNALVRLLMDRFDISQVILTQGADGSVLYTKNQRIQSTPAPVKTMADSVGAGDAFAAMFSACTLTGQAPEQALAAASAFASRICEIPGAILQSADFYAPFKEKCHAQKPGERGISKDTL
jgi:fructokinase